ncbi:MAG: potassium channel family protein [Chloroflexota bacterium]
MAKRSSVIIIGLGRFGSSLARTLAANGHEVLGIDSDLKKVEDIAEDVTQAAQADATDEDALAELGVRNFDIGVVAIGTDIKSSILTTLLLKKLGVNNVIAKANDHLHAEILDRIGADSVVFPESDTGVRVAHTLGAPSLVDYMQVMRGYGIAKIVLPKAFAGKHMEDIDLKGRFGVTPLILVRGEDLIVNPSRHQDLQEKDVLVISGSDEQMEDLAASMAAG